jgi:exopolysaccharide production protein ExoZ
MFTSVQYLRGIAALLVVFHHTVVTQRFAINQDNATSVFGLVGVDIFFVISGFIMCYTTARAPISPVEFMIKRVVRIVPLYWVVTLAMFVMPFFSNTISGGQIEIRRLIPSLFFVFWGYPDTIQPVYPPGWTLNYEMFFYIVFAFALALKPSALVFVAVVTFLGSLVLLGWAYYIFVGPTALSDYSSSLLLEFCLGMTVARLVTRNRVSPVPLAFAALILGAFALVYFPILPGPGFTRIVSWGIPSAFIVFGAASLERARGTVFENRLLKRLGDASYSIYLTHMFAIGAMAVVWSRLDLKWSGFDIISFVLAGFLTSTLLGILTHLWVERPLIRLVGSRWRTPTANVLRNAGLTKRDFR